MRHVFIRNDYVILRGAVIGNVMIDNQSQQAVQHGQIDFFEHSFKFRLQHHDAFAFARVPDIGQVVDALTPLIHQQRRRLCIRWFNPVREQVPLIGLVPNVLIQIRIRDLLQRFNRVHRNQVRIHVHKLHVALFKRSLC